MWPPPLNIHHDPQARRQRHANRLAVHDLHGSLLPVQPSRADDDPFPNFEPNPLPGLAEIEHAHVLDVQTATIRESKGWIGERDDPEVGLTYLNARYYDPVLARFIQPDWWDPTDPAVGTNRYAYGLNNPILQKDPSGHCVAGCVGDAGLAVYAAVVGAVAIAAIVASYYDDTAILNQNTNPDYEDAHPLGVEVTSSGKIHGDVPSADDITGASDEELADYNETVKKSIRQREEEYAENKYGLTPAERAGYRARIEKEKKSLEIAERERAFRDALEAARNRDKEKNDGDGGNGEDGSEGGKGEKDGNRGGGRDDADQDTRR
ncbi:RHS repeat-associated core domain-containing protein [Breoghania corrubedonensis]|nr:RHS repeat-associated core domain-containing protein [Breoghania corrubedonensis]